MNNLLDHQDFLPGNPANTMSNQHLFDSEEDEDEEENIIDEYARTTSLSATKSDQALPTLKQLFTNPERPDPINLWQFYKFLATSPNGKLINLLDFYLDYKSHLQFVKNNKSSETVQTVTFLSNNIQVKELKLNSDAIYETYFQKGANKYIMHIPKEDMEEKLPIFCTSIYHLLEAELYPTFLKSLTYHNIHSSKTSLNFCLLGTCSVWLGFWLYYCFVFLKMNRAYRLIALFLILLGTYMVLNIGLLRIDLFLYSLDLIQMNDDTDSDNIGRIGKEKSFKVGDELTFNSFGRKGELLRKFSNSVYGGSFINYKKDYGIHYILKKKILYSATINAIVSCILIALLVGVPGRRL